MKIHFILICEGPSDGALVSHLRSLLVESGAKEAIGSAPVFGRLPKNISRDIATRIQFVMKLEEKIDLLFIHRDADSENARPRYDEISNGVAKSGYSGFCIGVVPVQETEAWLLLDESAIRRVAGRPNGKTNLNLPPPKDIEKLKHPKEFLLAQIIQASETSGRKRDFVKKRLLLLRTQLLTELKISGQLQNLQSWVRLKTDIAHYIETVNRS